MTLLLLSNVTFVWFVKNTRLVCNQIPWHQIKRALANVRKQTLIDQRLDFLWTLPLVAWRNLATWYTLNAPMFIGIVRLHLLNPFLPHLLFYIKSCQYKILLHRTYYCCRKFWVLCKFKKNRPCFQLF